MIIIIILLIIETFISSKLNCPYLCFQGHSLKNDSKRVIIDSFFFAKTTCCSIKSLQCRKLSNYNALFSFPTKLPIVIGPFKMSVFTMALKKKEIKLFLKSGNC